MRCYLRAATGKQGEDVRVDEVELRLNLVAAEVVNGRAILIQDQVLGVRPKPRVRQTMLTVPIRERLHLWGDPGDEEQRADGDAPRAPVTCPERVLRGGHIQPYSFCPRAQSLSQLKCLWVCWTEYYKKRER